MAAPPGSVQPNALKFIGEDFLAQRLILATLTGKPIRVVQIRADSLSAPGLAPHEVSLLRLLEAVTNGSHIELSYSGTALVYRPGLIVGTSSESGGVLHFELPADCIRGASYFLEMLCLLAPFSKGPFNVLLTGPGTITSPTTEGDIGVDTVRTALLPIYQRFGIERNLELRVLRRSHAGRDGRGGAGEVQLVFGHQVRLPKTLHLLSAGRVKRVRGVATATGVPGANNARAIEAARALLNDLVPDTYVFSDITAAPFIPNADRSAPKRKTGLGFGLSLVAETTTGVLYSADVTSSPAGGDLPEDIGTRCALQLLEAIEQGGCVSCVGAPTMLVMMAMGSEDVGRVTLGKDVLASERVVQLARDLRDFGMSGWGMREGEQEHEAVVSIVGRGVGNVGKKIA